MSAKASFCCQVGLLQVYEEACGVPGFLDFKTADEGMWDWAFVQLTTIHLWVVVAPVPITDKQGKKKCIPCFGVNVKWHPHPGTLVPHTPSNQTQRLSSYSCVRVAGKTGNDGQWPLSPLDCLLCIRCGHARESPAAHTIRGLV